MAVLPEEIPTGTLKGQFYFVNEDNIDADTKPELTVVKGFVRCVASVKTLRMSSKKAVVIPLRFDAEFDSQGNLKPVEGTGIGMELPAVDSPLFDTTGWTWTATFELVEVETGFTVNLAPVTFQIFEGQVTDLSDVIPVAPSPGVITTRGPEGPEGLPGKDGQDGLDGSNVLPTNDAVAQAIETEGPTKTALSAAIAESSDPVTISGNLGVFGAGSVDTWERLRAAAAANAPAPLVRYRAKLLTDPANVKILFTGDSTTDAATGAVNIGTRLATHTAAGGALAGVQTANIIQQGFGGMQQSNFNNYRTAIVTAAPDLVIYSWGINDLRAGARTPEQLKAGIIENIGYLRGMLPNADFILRMPNAFTSDNVENKNFVSGATAQKRMDDLYNVYESLVGHWTNVAVWNSQGRIFGRTARTFADMAGLMRDQIHPSDTIGYPAIADALVSDLIGLHATPARWTNLRPAELKDTGNRPDTTTPGIADTGHPYLTLDGTFGITGGKLHSNAATGLARLGIDPGFTDGEFGVTFDTLASGSTVHFGYTYPGSTIYVTYNGTKYTAVGSEVIGGVVTEVLRQDIVGTPTNGDKIKCVVSKGTFQLYLNGTLAVTKAMGIKGTRICLQATSSASKFSGVYAIPA